ncbi:bifunctional UDP-N-acetylglucosamine diphosphorylase/glucosamine-1-phosphate N-acetyltransferase GlmU [Ectothiorhodospiraceae bacterium WFHF3C12]|nr:bifunctional UDP-N-acetylglucosamine diphosphorylase/glucosamine-1-phosphate N-acetyltransferase GlmU [Ectothiorhodospiraceae bacterium WFHF3C12]
MSIVILAAGQGTRMRSTLPKVLHPVAGRPMLAHVLDTARSLSPHGIYVVHGHGGEQVREALDAEDLAWVEQAEQLGTGHALMQALPAIPDDHRVLVLCGDVPLVRSPTLAPLIEQGGIGLALLTITLDDPTGYGRIVRDAAGQVQRVVEQKDATDAEKAIREINTGVLCATAARFRRWMGATGNDNAQGEYYLTDAIALAVAEDLPVITAETRDPMEVQGINNRQHLALVERACQRRLADALMTEGVTLMDPARLDVRGTLACGADTVIDVGCVFEGEVTVGSGVSVGAHCVIRDARLADGVTVEPHSIIDGAEIAADCNVGPFARIRPGTRLDAGARVGNFVETKNAQVGPGSKINHLAYVGDAEVGRDVNIGAGTITCNYDGANKHKTVIGDGAFIGSDTQLVAPVKVGRGATIGAGSTIVADAPDNQLTLSRSRQTSIPDWERPKKD